MQLRFWILLLLFLESVILQSQVGDISFRNIDIWESSGNGQRIREAAQDQEGNLWLTSTEGVYRFDNNIISSYIYSADGNSLSSNQTFEVYVNSKGRVMVGTEYGSIDIYDPHQNTFVPFISANSGMRRIYHISEDPEGNYLIGANQGIFRYHVKKDSLESLLPIPPVDPRGLGIRTLLPDVYDPDLIWFGGLSVFGTINLQNTEFSLIHHPYHFKETGNPLMILDLYQAPDQTIYACTWGGAIIAFDPVSDKWDQFNVLPESATDKDQVIFKISPQNDSTLWFASAGHVGRFNLSTKTYTFLEMSDNNPLKLAPATYFTELLITDQGNIVIAREKGFSISTSLITGVDTLPYKPVISSVSIDNIPVEVTNGNLPESRLRISPKGRELVISLAAPGYFNSSPVKYSYFLEGFDKDWSQPSSDNTIRYTNLIPNREFSFHYKARNQGTSWKHGTTFKVKQEALVWQIPIFQFGSLAVISGLAIFLFQFRIKSIKKQEAVKAAFVEQKADLELKALRAQMNPHFIFNSLNSIKHYILTNEPFKAAEYLTDFATLIRTTMQHSSRRMITLTEELDTLYLYVQLEQMRFKETFDFNCVVEPDVDTDNVKLPPLILQPYVENAIWHGLMHKDGPGIIQISIGTRQNGTVIHIEDNGVGREKAKLMKSKSATNYKSMGMGITRNRVEIHNRLQKGGITIDVSDRTGSNGQVSGTIVTLFIPSSTIQIPTEIDQDNHY